MPPQTHSSMYSFHITLHVIVFVTAFLTFSSLSAAVELHLPSFFSTTGISRPERLPFEKYSIEHPESRKAVEQHRKRLGKPGPTTVLHERPGKPSLAEGVRIFQQDWSECHSSSIVEVEDGVLLAVWFAGTEENAPDVAVYSARFVDGRWGAVKEVVPPLRRERYACGKGTANRCKGTPSTWNPVVSALPSGEVLLFYKTGPSPSAWTGYIKRSADGGLTWSEAVEMPANVTGPAKNKPLVLPSGAMLAPASTEEVGPPTATGGRERLWRCWVDESTDGGHTWERRGPIPFVGNIIQPVFFLDSKGRVRMLARSATELTPDGKKAEPKRDPKDRKHMLHPGKKYVIAATADPLGRDWSPARPTLLPCPNSGLDAVKLADGRLLVAHNDMFDTDEDLGRKCPKYRCRLALSVSPDDGATWKKALILADAKGDVENSYPAIIQATDGNIHITYTDNRISIRHIVLSPEQIP